jgi:Ala-tRNA(Pro) deacylase
MQSKDRLEAYLRDNRVAFQTQHHPLAYTSQEVAASEHVPGRLVVKVVIVDADGKQIMLALPATHRVNLDKVSRVLGAEHVRLAEEREFEATFPDCELGAMSPFGNLYNVPVYVDHHLTDEDTIICEAGTHTETISLAYADFARLAQPTVADFAEQA